MGIDKFRKSVELAVELLSMQERGDKCPPWLHESALAGMAEAGLETLPADVGFLLGVAVAKFRRIAREVADADGIVEPEQTKEAAAALLTISRILKSLPTTK